MRHEVLRSVLNLSLAATLVGCASNNNAAPSTRQQAESGDIPPSMLQWTGKFRQGEQMSAMAGIHVRNTSVGDVRLTADSRNVTRAQINFALDVDPALTGGFRWALASGECGTDSFPVLPVNQFPLLQLSNNRGSLDAPVNFPLPTSGRYHVDVYQSAGADQGDVMGCANVTLGRKGREP